MYLKRKAFDRLLEWKNQSKGATAILIEGARRVGKTYLALEFAQKHYRSFVHIDFRYLSSQIRTIFEDYAHDLDEFFNRLSFFTQTRLYPRQSCVIFDDVQFYPAARQLIKHLVADGRFDYIETGALVNIKPNVVGIVVPSEEQRLPLNPLDFEEFLEACGQSRLWSIVQSSFDKGKPVGDEIHHRVMRLFRTYLLVGGMPEAVCAYAQDKSFQIVRETQRALLELYRSDLADNRKAKKVFEAIARQLDGRDKRFFLSSFSKHARFRDYAETFCWLADTKLINVCMRKTDPALGLSLVPSYFKCYLADTGLLSVLAEQLEDDENKVVNTVLYGDIGYREGLLLENAVSQMFHANGHDLFFFRDLLNTTSKRSTEIDFLIRLGKKISPIEVKSADASSHPSLDAFVAKYTARLGKRYLISTKDYKREGELVHLPVYMTPLLLPLKRLL